MSSGIYIYLEVERYLKEYLNFHFGDPVRLPANSPENKLIRRHLSRLPENTNPDLQPNQDISFVRIEIPYSKEKDPREYNFLFPSVKDALRDSLITIFENHMWTDLLDIKKRKRGNLTLEIYAWCETNGISNMNDDKNFETIRQKFYRMRHEYRKNNQVKLS
ncbi:hypothetical protein D0T84_16335 [Dysgonomonas sp. 521]|uniref:hypothetical protein n=1 Tax=Dysgonomonas sp. 521 TaxID=2302932 RepID=UPI0013CFCE5D|nr:hypothetical protein [Dysgonomonas sp. 521]NDV96470.1 hypothetical protein [Dysgonomonas sp. 521]